MGVCQSCHKRVSEEARYCSNCGAKLLFVCTKIKNRERGTGTVRYDKRSTGNAFLALAPSTSSGQGRHSLGSYPTREEAENVLDTYLKSAKPDFINFTISQLYDKWREFHFENLEPNGIQGYKTAYKYLSDIYDRKVRDISICDLQVCIDKCAKQFGYAQCSKIKQLCSQLCKFSITHGILSNNLSEYLILPKNIKKEKEIFSDEDIKVLWQNTDNNTVRIILFMIYTGFRIGEVFRLKKKNIHLDERYIQGGIKSEAGKNRIVPIVFDEIMDFVREWYANTNGENLISGDVNNFRKRDFYPTLADLKIIDPPIEKVVKQKDSRANNGYRNRTVYDFVNPRVTPHSTRHNFVCLCIDSEIPPDVIISVVGHSAYQTTLDNYYHININHVKNGMQNLKKLRENCE